MYSSLAQENINVYSADPAGAKEKPGNPYYQNGVDVGYTAPAKWWNWLLNHLTAWLGSSKADKEAMTAEMKNTLSAASITPDSQQSNQLSAAIDKIERNVCAVYNDAEESGHKVNQPYVVGHTLYIPDTELL